MTNRPEHVIASLPLCHCERPKGAKQSRFHWLPLLLVTILLTSTLAAAKTPAPPDPQADTARGMQAAPARGDSGAMPSLEIPEITIVGKKAITLPFARKGEIYDVSLYEAPPPDTALLRDNQTIALPQGTLSRYEEHQMPWRASVEGAFGSFSTGLLRAYADYKTQEWGIYGNGTYRTTGGHVDNASGSTTALELRAHSLLSTDNDVLRALRVAGGLGLKHDSYGMFGLPGPAVDRTRSNESFGAEIGSVNRQGSVIDLSIDANIWNVTDNRAGADSDVSVVSPELRGSVKTDLEDTRLGAGFLYTGSSLNYRVSTPSPSLLGFSADARWKLGDQWSIQAGAFYQNGSGSDGSSTTLVAPTAVLQWEASEDREWIFWFQPELHLPTYDEEIRENPYLVRELELRPESRPVRLGTSLSYRNENLTLRLAGTVTHSTNRGVTAADSGRLRLEYVNADQLVVEASGTVNLLEGIRVKFTGALQPGHETGTSVQLPMVPIAEASGRGEVDLAPPVTIWSSVEYRSKRNADLAGSRTLGDVYLMGCGLSARLVPRMVLSFEVANLFNTGYEWWSGYSAPGRQLTIDAKLGL